MFSILAIAGGCGGKNWVGEEGILSCPPFASNGDDRVLAWTGRGPGRDFVLLPSGIHVKVTEGPESDPGGRGEIRVRVIEPGKLGKEFVVNQQYFMR